MNIQLSLLALALGLAAHTLKQLISSRTTGGKSIGLYEYWVTSWPETCLSVALSAGLFLGYPEVGSMFPTLGAVLTLPTTWTPLGGFVCGFIGNSLADVIGKRLTKVVKG